MSSMDLEGTLEQAILNSEQKRVTIVGVLAAALLVTAFNSMLQIPDSVPLTPRVLLISIQALCVAHQLAIRAVIARALRTGKPLSAALRYSTMVVETNLPTVTLGLAGLVMSPQTTLEAPVALLYFVFIAASTLRMDFALSLATGVTAGAGYAGVALWLLRGQPAAVLGPLAPGPVELHLSRAGMMIVCGLVAGLVGLELRKRLRQTMNQLAERTRVTELFGQHVSPRVVEKLLVGGAGQQSELRKVCVMFFDIRGFTTFAEGRTPKEVVDYLNQLFSVSIDAINQHGGIVNKFLGDGFMAVFGAPLSEGFDSRNAVLAAREVIAQLERRVAAGELPATRVGIGLHCGDAMTGNIGSSVRKEYTIIGDVVNLASRVEALNKDYGSTILATAPVVGEAGDAAAGAVDLGEVAIRGRADPIRLYRIV